jgi:hypothetical protein
MKRKCRICGTRLEVNANNFYRCGKVMDGFRSECKKCSHAKVEKQLDEDNAFMICHRWLECAFNISPRDYDNQILICEAVGGVLGRGF